MSMVHASSGRLPPASEHLRSEPAIIAGLAKAVLQGRHGIDWDGMIGNYDSIRDAIEVVFPDFKDFNARIQQPGGFRLDIPASRREWRTPTGKALINAAPGLNED